MRRPEPTIFTGWWDFAVRAFSLLTVPRADIDRCDRDVEALARESLVGRALHAVSLAIRRAWAASRTRAVESWLASALTPAAEAASWRIGGWMIAVVGGTVLGLERFASPSGGPLVWVLPAALLAAGLLVMAAAAPLSRAAADRRRRLSSSST